MIRSALPVVLVLALAGCGFHLRDKLALPEDSPPVRVTSNTPYSQLVIILERSLRNAGAEVAQRDPQGKAGDKDGDEPRFARLEILSERWGDLPIAIDERGRAQEFSLRYATIFTFRLADGRALVPQQVVELSRDYISQPRDATGTSTEREILADELRREMAASIMRRIDSVVRADLARAATVEGVPPVAEPATGEPSADEPAGAPSIDAPAFDGPASSEPAVAEPTVAEPTIDEPTVDEPTVDKPTVDEPTVDEPASSEPAAVPPSP
jgi:LPS-assembly lipoprotein